MVTRRFGAGALNRPRAGTLSLNVRRGFAHRPSQCPAGSTRCPSPLTHCDLSRSTPQHLRAAKQVRDDQVSRFMPYNYQLDDKSVVMFLDECGG